MLAICFVLLAAVTTSVYGGNALSLVFWFIAVLCALVARAVGRR